MADNTLVAEMVTKCRVCGNTDLVPCITIGEQYLSSVFPTDLNYKDTAKKYPLDISLCNKNGDDKRCGTVQLSYRLDLTPMYDAYPYTSSTNSSMGKILEDVAKSARDLNHLSADDAILDIGGNDGTLLNFFKNDPYTLINIDPAKNVQSLIESPRYTHVRNFFSEEAFNNVSTKKAKLIFSIAMFYHLDDPMKLVRNVAACLQDGGVWIIQMAYLPAMIHTNMYDNIVHEHACYYGANHMKWIMEQVGLEVFDVMENDVYGGSFRIFVKKQGNAKFPATDRYKKILETEIAEGLYEKETYTKFTDRINKTREDLIALCKKIKTDEKSIWIYGASTKGNTILQYCDIGKETITAAADANPFKVGKLVIGSDIPIVDEIEMRKAKPDYLLALPYSFIDGFMKREAELLAGGTKFIVPLPEVKVLN